MGSFGDFMLNAEDGTWNAETRMLGLGRWSLIFSRDLVGLGGTAL